MEKLKEKLSYGEKCMADELEEWNKILDKKSILRIYTDLGTIDISETFAGSLNGVQILGKVDIIIGEMISIVLSDYRKLHIFYKNNKIESVTLFDTTGKTIGKLDWEEAWDGNN